MLFVFIEKFCLRFHPKKSGISTNVAEGYGRFYYQENIRFCYNARGSLEETLSHLAMCYELKYISQPLFDSLGQDGEKLTQLINGYIGYLKRSKQGQSEPGANHSVRENSAPYNFDQSEIPADDSQFPNPE